MFEIKPVSAPEQKLHICDSILHALPNWFGIETAIIDYVKDVQKLPFWAAYDGETPVGFAALKKHNRYTSEIYVMGIAEEYHRKGIGRKLIAQCESYCISSGSEYLTVKTLDESRESRSYAKTRQFYYAVGFCPLEVFPLYWGEDNPCLFMAKHLHKRNG